MKKMGTTLNNQTGNLDEVSQVHHLGEGHGELHYDDLLAQISHRSGNISKLSALSKRHKKKSSNLKLRYPQPSFNESAIKEESSSKTFFDLICIGYNKDEVKTPVNENNEFKDMFE